MSAAHLCSQIVDWEAGLMTLGAELVSYATQIQIVEKSFITAGIDGISGFQRQMSS